MNEEFKPGLYRHYKGGLYLALFLATHHETGEMFVVYIPYGHPESRIRMREYATPGKDSWTDVVTIKNPNPESTSFFQAPRFERVGDLVEERPI